MNTSDILTTVVKQCGLAKLDKTGVAPGAVSTERAVKKLARDLKITPVRKADIIQIEYTSKDPQMAAEVLRRLSALYLDAHLRLHSSPGTHEFFRVQATRYGAELHDVESRLLIFREQNNIVATAQQRDLLLLKSAEAEATLMDVDGQISETRQKLGKTSQKILGVQPRVLTQSRSLPNQYSIERLRTIQVELQNRRTQLLTKFQPVDRLVQEVDQQIADTSAALQAATSLNSVEEDSDINPLRQSLEAENTNHEIDLTGLTARRTVLAGQVKDYHRRLSALIGASEVEETLMRARKEAESNYLSLFPEAGGEPGGGFVGPAENRERRDCRTSRGAPYSLQTIRRVKSGPGSDSGNGCQPRNRHRYRILYRWSLFFRRTRNLYRPACAFIRTGRIE